MTALTTRARLVEQYQRATSDSGRYERADRSRFLRHLLATITAHTDYAVSRESPGNLPEWQDTFLRETASKQGREAATVFAFLLRELAARVGQHELRDDLVRDKSPLAVSISRRMAAPVVTSGVRLAAVRIRTEAGTFDTPLSSMPADGGECARHDVLARIGSADGLSSLGIAVAVDNPSRRTAHATGVEVRIQCQTASSGCYLATPVSVFACAHRIEAQRRAWLAFRGVDLIASARAALPPGERIDAVRLLVSRL